jgi:hypothetical protein
MGNRSITPLVSSATLVCAARSSDRLKETLVVGTRLSIVHAARDLASCISSNTPVL